MAGDCVGYRCVGGRQNSAHFHGKWENRAYLFLKIEIVEIEEIFMPILF